MKIAVLAAALLAFAGAASACPTSMIKPEQTAENPMPKPAPTS